MNTVEGGLGNTTEQTGGQSTRSGLTQFLVTVAQGQDEYTQGGAEAGEVPGTHGALNEVRTGRGDVGQLQSVKRPVQTQRYQERIQQRNEDSKDDRGGVVQPRQARTNTVT